MNAIINTVEELVDLPRGTVVHSDAGTIACRRSATKGVVFGMARDFDWTDLALPVTVLWPRHDVDGLLAQVANLAADNDRLNAERPLLLAVVEAAEVLADDDYALAAAVHAYRAATTGEAGNG